MDIAELKDLSEDELAQKLQGFKRELFDLRMQAAAGKLEKSHQIRVIRRDVARVLTLLKDRQLSKKEK